MRTAMEHTKKSAVSTVQSDMKRKLPDGWRWVKLAEFMPKKVGSIDPSMDPDEAFVLYSIPSFDRGEPDTVFGKTVGSTKQIVRSGDVLLSKIVPIFEGRVLSEMRREGG